MKVHITDHHLKIAVKHDHQNLLLLAAFLHRHFRVTSLRIIQFPCISWIGIRENYAV